jgi:hypothetical protein
MGGVMNIPEPKLDSELVALLDADELRKVLAILRSHRRSLIVDLPPGARSVVNSIIRAARLRGPRERKGEAPEVATLREARKKAGKEMANARPNLDSKFRPKFSLEETVRRNTDPIIEKEIRR